MDAAVTSEATTIDEPSPTKTTVVEYAGIIPRHRNLFRFTDGDMRIGVQSRPAPQRKRWWHLRAWIGDPDPVNMMALSERDFDDLDITRKGQPEAYCILAPGLAVCWPTTDRDYIVTVLMGV